MFREASSFDQDISGWDVSKVCSSGSFSSSTSSSWMATERPTFDTATQANDQTGLCWINYNCEQCC